MADNRRSLLFRLLDLFCCCCRGSKDKKKKFEDKDDIIVTRIYKSSSVMAFHGNQEVIAEFPYIPKQSRSDIFNTGEVIGRHKIEHKQRGRDDLEVCGLSSGTSVVGGDGVAPSPESSEGTQDQPPSHYDVVNQQRLAVAYVATPQGGQLVGPYGFVQDQPLNSEQSVPTNVWQWYQESRYKRLLVSIIVACFVIFVVIIILTTV